MSSRSFATRRLGLGAAGGLAGPFPALLASALILVLALLPGSLSAQGSPSFWGGIGVGTGSARLSCDICTNDRTAGMSGSAALGFRVGERVRLGVEGNAWRDTDGDLETLLWTRRPGAISAMSMDGIPGARPSTAPPGPSPSATPSSSWTSMIPRPVATRTT